MTWLIDVPARVDQGVAKSRQLRAVDRLPLARQKREDAQQDPPASLVADRGGSGLDHRGRVAAACFPSLQGVFDGVRLYLVLV